MSLLDYKDLFEAVVLINIDEKPELSKDLSERLVSFSFNDQNGKKDKVTIVLSDYDRRLTEGDLIQPDDVWEVRWGYYNDMSRTRVITLKEWTPIYSDGAATVNLTFTVNRGKTNSGKYGTEMDRVARPKLWGIIQSSEIAKKIARRHKLKYKGVDSKDANKELPYVQPGNVSDYEYLNQLAYDINFEFFIEDNTLFYRAPALEERPRRAFYYYPQTNQTYLLSFTPKVKVTRHSATKANAAGTKGPLTKQRVLKALKQIQGGSSAPVVRAYIKHIESGGEINLADEALISIVKKFEKRNLPQSSGNTTSGDSPTASPGGQASGETPTKSVGRIEFSNLGGSKRAEFVPTAVTTVEDKPSAKAAAQQNKAKEKAVTASATFIGSPTIRTRTNIYIGGVGKRFSGNWYVKSCTHTITESRKYSVSAELKRGALKDTAKGQKTPKKKEDEKPQKQPDRITFKNLGGKKRASFTPGGEAAVPDN